MVPDLLSLLVAVGVPVGTGALGGVVTARAIPVWYVGLAKPAWNPPAAVFAPVWTALYALMGVAVWWVWRAGWEQPGVPLALGLFGVQLLANLGWSLVFFGLRRPGWALAEIALLWLLIALTGAQFASVSLVAAGLLVPYLAWVTFAAALNAAVWRLNR